MPNVEQLIEALTEEGREGGARVAGSFSIDREKAREKMRLFQLPDPRTYVLELVQAAVIKGATMARFDIDADDMRMAFDGEPFTVDDFDQIYGSLLASVASDEAVARRQLALGLNAAMALNPRFIVVRSGDGRQTARLEMRPGRDDRFGLIDEASRQVEGTLIHVKQRFRPGLAVAFVRNIAGTLAEEQLLRSRCRFSSVPIDLEGTVVSKGMTLPGAIVSVPFESGDLRGVVGLSANATASQAVLTLVTNGVWIASHGRDDLMPGLVAVVEGRRLRKNVSQTDVVRDQAYDDLVTNVHWRRFDVLKSLARRVRQERLQGEVSRLERLLKWSLAGCSALDEARAMVGGEDDSYNPLLDVPLWREIRGYKVTLRDLFGELTTHGAVAYSTMRCSDWPSDDARPIVFVSKDDEAVLLRHLFGEQLEDWTERVWRVDRRAANQREWQCRRRPARLGHSWYAAKAPVVGEGVRGEVGANLMRTDLSLTLVKDGGVLVERSMPFSVIGLEAVIEADFSPTELFDDAEPDIVLARALSAMLDALVLLFSELAAWNVWTDQRASCLSSFLTTLGRVDARRRALEQLAIPEEVVAEVCDEPHGSWDLELLLRPRDDEPGAVAAALTMRAAPVLLCWDGRRLSVDDLAREIEEQGVLRTVDDDARPLAEPSSIARRYWAIAERHAADHLPSGVGRPAEPEPERPVLRKSELLEVILTRLCGDVPLLDFGSGDFLRRARAFLDHPTAEPAVTVRTVASVPIRGEGVTGELAVLEGDGAGLAGTVTLYTERRRLGLSRLAVPIRRLCAAVDFDGLEPNVEWSGAVEDEATATVRRAVARALPALLARLVPQGDGPITEPRARQVLLEAITAIFPSPAFRYVYEALISKRGVEQAELDYRGLLRFGAAVRYEQATSMLEASTNQGKSIDVPSIIRTMTSRTVDELVPAFSSRDYGDGRPAVVVPGGALAWMDALFPPDEAKTSPLSERVLHTLPGLGGAMLFESYTGRPVTLAEVVGSFERAGKVYLVSERFVEDEEAEQLVLFVDDWETMNALKCLVGEGGLRYARTWLEARRRKWHFEAIPRLEALTLAEGAAMVTAPIDHKGLIGEVGLAAQHPGNEENVTTIRLCTDRREVSFEQWRSELVLRAIVNDDSLVMNDTCDAIASDPTGDGRLEACYRQVPALVGALCDRWPDLDIIALGTARRHVLDLLVVLGEEAGPEGAEAMMNDEPWRRLAALPVFRALTGELLSLDDLYRRTTESGAPAVLCDLDAVVELPEDQKPVAIVVDACGRRRLQRVSFLRVEGYEELVERRRAAEEASRSEEIEASAGADSEDLDDQRTTLPFVARANQEETDRLADALIVPQTREQRFLDAVREMLTAVGLSCFGWSGADAFIWDLCFEWNDAPIMVVMSGRAASLNRQHTAVEVALARFEDDPMWIAFVAAAVVTAVEAELEEVTASDGALMLQRLTERVVGGCAADGG